MILSYASSLAFCMGPYTGLVAALQTRISILPNSFWASETSFSKSSFRPMWERDPHFSSGLVEAYYKGVKINCITLNISKSEITFNEEISLNLEKRD